MSGSRGERWILGALLASAGCQSGEPTEILLTVQSDLVVSDDTALAEMDTIRLRVLRYEREGAPGSDPAVEPPPIDLELGTPVTVDGSAYTFRWGRDFPIGDRTLPLEIAVAPEGRDATRVALLDAYALKGGTVVVGARVRAGFVRGRVVRVLLTLDAACRDAECPSGQTCQDGDCVPIDRDCLVDCDAGPPVRPDAGPSDAGPRIDAAGVDAGPGCDPTACDDGDPCNGIEGCVAGRCAVGEPLRCDDGIGCTIDSCGRTGCQHAPSDAACTAAPEGRCDARLGCQYPACTAATCVADPCGTARCDGDTCVRESLCGAGQTCCAGGCVTAGCDDGNPCTADSCGTTGCVHSFNANPCSDGLFCNGADHCSGGTCSSHAGNPCGAMTPLCLEVSDTCVQCRVDGDCGMATAGTWSGCGWMFACDEMATRSRTIYTPRCVSNSCTTVTTTETEDCVRDTDGRLCGSGTTYGPWSACTYASSCDQEGSRTREVTTRRCDSGGCYPTVSTQTEVGGACARSTDGVACDDGDECTENDRCAVGTCFGRSCVLGITCPSGMAPTCDPTSGCYCS